MGLERCTLRARLTHLRQASGDPATRLIEVAAMKFEDGMCEAPEAVGQLPEQVQVLCRGLWVRQEVEKIRSGGHVLGAHHHEHAEGVLLRLRSLVDLSQNTPRLIEDLPTHERVGGVLEDQTVELFKQGPVRVVRSEPVALILQTLFVCPETFGRVHLGDHA